MKAQGAIDRRSRRTFQRAAKMDDCENEVLLYEFKADLNKYLKALGPSVQVHSLAELIAFNSRERIARCRSSVRSSCCRQRRRERWRRRPIARR